VPSYWQNQWLHNISSFCSKETVTPFGERLNGITKFWPDFTDDTSPTIHQSERWSNQRIFIGTLTWIGSAERDWSNHYCQRISYPLFPQDSSSAICTKGKGRMAIGLAITGGRISTSGQKQLGNTNSCGAQEYFATIVAWCNNCHVNITPYHIHHHVSARVWYPVLYKFVYFTIHDQLYGLT